MVPMHSIGIKIMQAYRCLFYFCFTPA